MRKTHPKACANCEHREDVAGRDMCRRSFDRVPYTHDTVTGKTVRPTASECRGERQPHTICERITQLLRGHPARCGHSGRYFEPRGPTPEDIASVNADIVAVNGDAAVVARDFPEIRRPKKTAAKKTSAKKAAPKKTPAKKTAA